MVERNDVPTARRFSDTVFATLIGPATKVQGEIRGEDAVDLAGTLEGDVRLGAHCRVRAGGRVVGAIDVKSLVVEGAVEAPEIVAEKIEIRTSARVEACLRAQVIAIAEGAAFDGEVHMHGAGAGGSPLIFAEQRRSPEER